MKTTNYKTSLAAALGAMTLASVLAGCGGGGGTPAVPNSLPTGAVTVSGTATQGQTLTVASTLADADGLGTLSYQWLADGVAIAGATNSTLVLGQAQVGTVISVAVSYVDGKGNHESASFTVTGKVVFAAANLQGIWTPGTVGGDAASLVVLSSGAAWFVVNHAGQGQMFTSTLAGTATGYAGTGTEYLTGSTVVNASVAFAASATPKATLNGTITPSGEAARAFSFAYDPRYDTPALLSDIAGTWKSTGAVVVTWSISAAGVLSGNSTLGCDYAGSSVAVHGATGVFDLVLNETCAGTVTVFNGIATLNAAKTGANFAFANSAGTEGQFVATSKAP